MNEQEVLALRFECSDLGQELSVKDYLIELLARVWEREESFSGKRPFGNSGWKGDLAEPLIRAGAIAGKVEEDDGYFDLDYDHNELDAVIARCIRAL